MTKFFLALAPVVVEFESHDVNNRSLLSIFNATNTQTMFVVRIYSRVTKVEMKEEINFNNIFEHFSKLFLYFLNIW